MGTGAIARFISVAGSDGTSPFDACHVTILTAVLTAVIIDGHILTVDLSRRRSQAHRVQVLFPVSQ